MKNLGLIGCNFEMILKKIFFNYPKNDFYHVYEQACNDTIKISDQDEDKEVVEYKSKYNSTTRWQTI